MVLLARKSASYQPVVTEIEKAGGRAFGVSADASSEDSVADAFGAIKSKIAGAKVAAAIYNVGSPLNKKPFLELNHDEFEIGFKVNAYVAAP